MPCFFGNRGRIGLTADSADSGVDFQSRVASARGGKAERGGFQTLRILFSACFAPFPMLWPLWASGFQSTAASPNPTTRCVDMRRGRAKGGSKLQHSEGASGARYFSSESSARHLSYSPCLQLAAFPSLSG